ncbi:glycosyltransferase family 2 protein [Leptodesmis sichuanensis]|uniref:glycosyltransferase family 2 protein n=1 Tax=Leptodesmis sichuanensis TaxID=2906798 RepID=UPI001F219ECF|nr:glycosyltransferase [Leptodesmis sichuanensis]UIE39912.1 glycosyltransferase [Leptodesmis sichuanensis A121]
MGSSFQEGVGLDPGDRSWKSVQPVLTISIIIPVYNGGANFHQCLSSLSAVRSRVLEIIVVDDGGTDDSGLLAKQIGAKVFKFASPGGPARARNRGARIAQGSILFFIDADVTLTEKTIDQVLATFRECPTLAALIGSYDDEPGAKNFLSQYKNLFHHYTHQTSCEEASTFWGACGAIRREAFWAVGGFDERYRYPSIEDIELGYRLKRAGYQIQLNKAVQVKHLKHWKVGSLLRAEIFYRAIPWTELLWRDQQFNNDLNLKHSSRLSLVCTYALLLCFIAGWWWFPAWLIGLGMGLILLILNWPLYSFFYQKRGLLFTVQVVFWHWLYFFYGGLAFAIGTVRHLLSRQKPSPA